jgi:hypothetical protein
MAIELEFINFIVPRSIIEKKYPGGWKQCLADHENVIGGRVYFDEYLFRDGAMNPRDIAALVEEWASLGFHTHDGGDTPMKWVDVCVVEEMSGRATLPCDWIEVDGNSAYLKNKPKGKVIGRDNFRDL